MQKNLLKGSLFLTDYCDIVRTLCDHDPDVAERFCNTVERHLKLLARHGLLGAKAGFRNAPDVRKWVIAPFRNYVIFYIDRPDAIVVVRLLHGARNLPPLIPPE